MTSETLGLSSEMARPGALLIILLAGGVGAGWWLLRRDPVVADAAPPPMLARVQDQVKAAEARAGEKALLPEAMPAAVPLAEGESPDFVGIAVELVRARELQSLPLSPVVLPREEVSRRIARWLALQFPGDYGVREGRALAALGAIPQAVDTIALRGAFWSHQIGAWCEGGAETLVLAERPEEVEGKENALGLAFGQLFQEHGADLFRPDEAPLDSDGWLARFGLIAGDAAFTRLRHALAHPRTGGGGGAGEDPDDPSRAIPLPAFLRERDLAAFGVGLDFVSSLHSLGKYDQVNAAYGRPPVASIELLEPSLYLAGRQFQRESFDPADLTVGGVAPYWNDTFGAISLVLLLKQRLPQPVAAEAVNGWRGDRLLAYAAAGRPRDHVAWETFWKDGNAADGFFSAMRQALLGRGGSERLDAAAPHGVFKIDGPDRFVVLTRTRSGRGVFYADAADAAFAAALWKKFAGEDPGK
jgi:hypothetical protein